MSKLRDLIADAEIDLLTLALACHLLLFFDLLAQISGNVKASSGAESKVAPVGGPIVPQALVVDLDVPRLGTSTDTIVLRAAVEVDAVVLQGTPPVDLKLESEQPLGTSHVRLTASNRPNRSDILRSLKLEIQPADGAELPRKVVLYVRRDRQRADGTLAAAELAGWVAASTASDAGSHEFSHVGRATGPAWQASAKAFPSAQVAAAWLPMAVLTRSGALNTPGSFEFQLDGRTTTFTHPSPPSSAPLPPGTWQTVFFRVEVTITPVDSDSSDVGLSPPAVEVQVRPTSSAPASLTSLPHP